MLFKDNRKNTWDVNIYDEVLSFAVDALIFAIVSVLQGSESDGWLPGPFFSNKESVSAT